MKPVEFEVFQTDQLLTSHSGLVLVGALLGQTRLRQRLDETLLTESPNPQISHGENVISMIALICLGTPDFEAIDGMRKDKFFCLVLGLRRAPSSSSLRQRIDMLAHKVRVIIQEESADMISRHAPAITPCFRDFVPLDIDVSPFDNSNTKKEKVSFTYKQFMGFAPIFAYLGKEGFQINVELREGKQHCQKETPEFLRASIRLSRRVTPGRILVRMDSGNDAVENVLLCIEEGVDCLIKRNIRKESVEDWLEAGYAYGNRTEPRPGKEVFRGDVWTRREGKWLRIVFDITRRTITPDGQVLLVPEVEVDTYWTTLKDSPDKLVDLYHDHGTSEQFHSEIKTDMNLERLPSGKFDTNALIMNLGMVAYNCLRLCGQTALRVDENLPPAERAPIRKKVTRRRLRSVIQDLVYMAGRLVYHSRRWCVSFGSNNRWYGVWRRVYNCFLGKGFLPSG